MPDLVLTHGYFLFEDEKEQQIMKPYPSLGLLYVSAYLRGRGFTIEVFDSTFAKPTDLTTRLDTDPSILGVYTTLITRQSVLMIVAAAKARGWTVVLGGPESANYPAKYLDHGADVVVVGEGELTVAELLPALASRGPHQLHDVAGIVFKDEDGQVVFNTPRQQIQDLDGLPWPDREQIDLRPYLDTWREHHGASSLNLITARGCPYRCRWCSHAVFGFTHRRRSYLDCADELEHIVAVYQPDQVWYADDVFTIHHRWLFKFANELQRRALHVPFETISRADRMMTDDVLTTLARMGCWRIWIGSESGSQRILDAMERGVTVEQVQWATRAAKRHGIQVGMFLMWGYEGEEFADIEATIEHVKEANPDVFFTTVAYPIGNTPYYTDVLDRLTLASDWATSTDRDYVIAGRRPREYYKHADRWLFSAVEAERAAEKDPSKAQRERERAAEARRALLRWHHP